MGATRTPAKVKIIVGILAKDIPAIEAVRATLREKFGEEDLNLAPFPFTFTNYYKEEIGDTPVRAFFSYEPLVERETIVDIKLWTNDLELEIAERAGTPEFQRRLESAAYRAGEGCIPVQTFKNFRLGQAGSIDTDFEPRIRGAYRSADLRHILPESVSAGIEEGILAYQMSTGKPYRLRRENN